MKSKILGFLAVALMAGPMAASASVITVSGAFTATNWQVYFGTPAGTPVDPLFLQYSVTFDDALTYDSNAAVLTVFSTNIPYSFDFSYGPGPGQFVLATNGSPAGCTHSASSFCAFVSIATGLATFVEQSASGGGGGWAARTITGGTPVPEPGTLALLGLGLAGLGMSRRRLVA